MATAMTPWDPARYPDGAKAMVKKGLFGNDYDVYDLSGKRIEHPQKGINIINGQKVIVK